MSINSPKWLPAHVWGNKNGLGCRTASPFVSADRYDPKEAFKHKHYDSKAFQNFLAHFNSTAHDRQHPLFEGQESHLGEIGLKTHKNGCLRAFLEIENVLMRLGHAMNVFG